LPQEPLPLFSQTLSAAWAVEPLANTAGKNRMKKEVFMAHRFPQRHRVGNYFVISNLFSRAEKRAGRQWQSFQKPKIILAKRARPPEK